jgi:hypothetical protein
MIADCSPHWVGTVVVFMPVQSTLAGLYIGIGKTHSEGRGCGGFGFIAAPPKCSLGHIMGFSSERAC